MPRPHPAATAPAGNHRSRDGTLAPPLSPAPWLPPSGPPCPRQWGRVLHTAFLSRRCAAWVLTSGGSLYELAILRRHAVSISAVKQIHRRPPGPRREGT